MTRGRRGGGGGGGGGGGRGAGGAGARGSWPAGGGAGRGPRRGPPPGREGDINGFGQNLQLYSPLTLYQPMMHINQGLSI